MVWHEGRNLAHPFRLINIIRDLQNILAYLWNVKPLNLYYKMCNTVYRFPKWGVRSSANNYDQVFSSLYNRRIETHQLLITSLHSQSLWLWRWLPHRLSKRQSLPTTTVLFRTTFTRTIKLNLLLKWLLGSNLSQ